MRILCLSDLHLEFDRTEDQQKSFITSLDSENVDVLVLAGDICLHRQIVEIMMLICKRFENADVIWVHGNHEFYFADRKSVIDRTNTALQQNKNLHWLDNDVVTIKGQRFVGTPMWFPLLQKNAELERYMNDFKVIRDFKSWVYEENARSTKFLFETVKQDDIVVTHYLPSRLSVAPRFSDGDLNNFFVCDVEAFIRSNGPKLWVHGHTHDSFDYEIPHNLSKDMTRVVCNPRGYTPHDLNPDFKSDLSIIV